MRFGHITTYLFAVAVVTASESAAPGPNQAAMLPQPSTAHEVKFEQAVIVFDRAHETEHMFYEVRFDNVTGPFAFFLATPTPPSVSTLASFDYTRIFDAFPFAASTPVSAPPAVASVTATARYSAALPPPVVLEARKPVSPDDTASFAASDSAALAAWVARHAVAGPPASWVNHYAKRGFHLLAFLFRAPVNPLEPPASKDHPVPLLSAPIKISFSVPQPFFPYRTSRHSGPMRVLLVGSDPMRPVAVKSDGSGQWIFKRPWAEGKRYPLDDLGQMDSALSKLSEGASIVQTFADEKQGEGRSDFGDVLMVPEVPRAYTPDEVQKRAMLMPVLAPELVEGIK